MAMNLTRLTAFGAGIAVIAATLVGTSVASQAVPTAQSEGIECEPGDQSSLHPSFSISTATGHISMPDGNVLFSWGFKTDSHAFQLPGPIFCVQQGATVSITLTNTLDEDTSLVFPGQSDVTANGNPSEPQFGGDGQLTSLAPTAAANGGQVTYTFTAADPGTYLYESGTDPAKQVEMGLYGAIVVRPAGHPDQAYADIRTKFQPGREFIHILAQVDPDLHLAVEQHKAFNWNNYSAKYFLLNGRSSPDTTSPNDASWLPSQPYGAMVHVKEQYQPDAPLVNGVNPTNGGDTLPALVRYINVMPTDAAFHPHGNTERVIAEDGQPLDKTGQPDSSYGKYLVDIGANRTVDAMFTWTNVENYNPITNPVPVPISPYQDVLTSASTWYSMSPYLGFQGELPAGVTSMNVCGEYYHMAHNHALQFATNFGASFGGQMTLIRIDPAANQLCLAQ
ncbi:MAG: multicopper oxidase domain-containing protein [Frankiales bacterium]|nr:multicopper oxidase domain-containing protein [Frankiales bacterium]